jgi:hypothetical protein
MLSHGAADVKPPADPSAAKTAKLVFTSALQEMLMVWGKTPKPPQDAKVVSLPKELVEVASRAEVERELDTMRESARTAYETRRRFWFYPTLTAVYAFYSKWKVARKSKKCGKIVAALYRVDRGHPLRVIIDAVTPRQVNNKTRTRWASGLLVAWKQGVSPDDLDNFCKKHGGIAGCARLRPKN